MPAKSSRLIVGLISGTSIDGIDAALVRISGPPTQPRVHLLAFETMPYPDWVRERLLAIAGGGSTTAEEIDQLDTLLGIAFGAAAVEVCRRGGIPPSRPFVIGSHGQTIHHRGRAAGNPRSLENGTYDRLTPWTLIRPCTLQIGEPAMIAERTGAPVVSDFRVADMAASGQGAPLVPMVDYLLLRHARKGTVALNIGGIANFTVIPANAAPEQVFGFDTGPGNMGIDGLVRHFTHGKKPYDAGGRWASRGKVLDPLLQKLLQDPFFAMRAPKSAGHEQFGQHFIQKHFLRVRRARPEDLLRTATEFTARSIAYALDRFVLSKVPIHRIIISGGGVHNRLLVARLGELLPKLRIHRSDDFGLDVDAKEAIAFAVLTDRTMHGLPGNLPSVTGARRSVVLGKISRPY